MGEWIFPFILAGAGLIVVSVLTSVLAFRFGAPLLLVFLSIGLLAGEDGIGIPFDDPGVAYFVGSLALAVILFDSGFRTRIQAFRQAAGPAIVLATVGVLLTTMLVGVAVHFLLGMPWTHAFLMGAIISSTDAAAVFFLLRVGGIEIKEQVRATLEIESGSNDPMAIFLTIFFLELITSGYGHGSPVIEFMTGFGMQMGLGMLFGLAGGYLIVQIVNRIDLESALYPIVVMGAALVLFALTGLLGGSGFLAVYIAGLVAGNRPLRGITTLRRYQEGMTWLAQIVMFLVLGLLASPSAFPSIALPAIGVALFLILIGRPLAVWLCLLPFGYERRETTFIAWVGLRGAVSILLAILPFIAGVDDAAVFFNTAFLIVLTSLLVQGWTIPSLARRLGLIVPARIGPVERIELELPGAAHHELVVYRVVNESPVMRGARLPRWARPSLVVRDGRSMNYQHAGRLLAGDYVYIFVHPRYVQLLDRLFASPKTVAPTDHEFFGEFKLDPHKSLALLRDAYGVEHTKKVTLKQPIGRYMQEQLGGRTVVGDRVAFGPVDLIVRDVDDQGAITEIGLSVQHGTPKPQPKPALNLRKFTSPRLWASRRRS